MTEQATVAIPPTLAHTIDIETPELVVVSYTVAGVGSRAYAALIDYLICFVAFIVLTIVLAMMDASRLFSPTRSGAVALALLVLFQFAILWGYYVLFEGLMDGQTPGKRRMRLRVVRDGGYSVTFAASAVRNLVRIVDMQPAFFYAVGLVSAVLSRNGKRLGDIVAGTLVVREALVPTPATIDRGAASEEGTAPSALETVLTEEELAVLARFVERRGQLPPERREELAQMLAQRFAHALPESPAGSVVGRLVRLYETERRERSRGAASRGAVGAKRERHAIVATRSPRWVAFAARLAEAQRRGLAALGEEEVRTFVAEYREVAADLARLRTASGGVSSDEMFYLGRLVSGAHNLLYRERSLALGAVARALFVEAPREVRRSWRPVLLAALLLFGPAAIAYTAVVRRPEVAPTFIPSHMLDRAQDGVRRAREGEGYITDPQILRPVMASNIVANNVQVSFAVFALGVTAGIGTCLLLVLNGVSLGGVFGLYASKGIARLLLAFVAPHGVLELTAICIAGGAGLLLAAALLVPGPRSRKRALVEDGRRAVRLVGAATVLLLVAGALEGFVSPIEWWPIEGKLAVSGVTACLLWLYLRSGAERPASTEQAPRVAPVDLLAIGSLRHEA